MAEAHAGQDAQLVDVANNFSRIQAVCLPLSCARVSMRSLDFLRLISVKWALASSLARLWLFVRARKASPVICELDTPSEFRHLLTAAHRLLRPACPPWLQTAAWTYVSCWSGAVGERWRHGATLHTCSEAFG